MSNATFYIIDPDSPQADSSGFLQYVVFYNIFCRSRAKVYLNCEDKHQAEQLAELFWQVDAKQYIAHNLVGEGPKYGTNIEIGYQEVKTFLESPTSDKFGEK